MVLLHPNPEEIEDITSYFLDFSLYFLYILLISPPKYLNAAFRVPGRVYEHLTRSLSFNWMKTCELIDRKIDLGKCKNTEMMIK